MTQTVEIRAPAEQTEGTRSQILRWLKAVGDEIALNEPLIELETDKVTVEVASPGSGVLQEILKQEQEDVGPGELLGRIGAGKPAAGAAASAASAPSAATAPGAAPAAPLAVGNRQSAHLLSPAVRRLLAEHSLDAADIEGTGEGGRVTVQDVLQRVTPDSSPQSAIPSHRVPHSPVRKRIAEHMVRSLLETAPHVTTVFEADLSAVLAHRSRNRETFASQGVPLTLTAYFLQAIVAAIRAVPEVNSRWTETALEVFDSIHIGVATALEDELLVPVLRNVDSLDLLQTARGLNDLITRAREHKLSPADVRGGTFTISNHGVSGSLLATPIVINQPQAAILGIGKLEKRVVVEEGASGEDRFIIQPRCYVTLTIDHRVLDGHRANRFLQTFVERLAGWD